MQGPWGPGFVPLAGKSCNSLNIHLFNANNNKKQANRSMTLLLQKAWDEVVEPFLRRPKRVQVAALCYRKVGKQKEVLLITSRDTGRWILPKGWPIAGKDAGGAAMQEAWEEAGVKKGQVANDAVGTFDYKKRLDGGSQAPCRTQVFPVEVRELSSEFPERGERKRKWVSPADAAEMVSEPELQDILRAF